MATAAYHRFQASMVLDFEKWHDGIGFDLTAIAEMTDEERQSIQTQLSHREKTWREIEALETLQSYQPPAADKPDPIVDAAKSAGDRNTRLAAAEALRNRNRMPDFDVFLAREICTLDRISDGCVRALLLAEEYPSEPVKQALLYASNRRTETAIHCAALLCYLCGKAESAFDWSMRPFFLRFGEDSDSLDRSAAFDELCKLTGLTLREPSDFSPELESS